jgi:hypothetical protein
MIFTQITGNDNIIQEVLQPIEEGWGVVASWFFNIQTAGAAPLATMLMSSSNLKKLLRNPKLNKYIVNACRGVLSKEKKRDSSVINKDPRGFIDKFRANWHGDDDTTVWERWAHYGIAYRIGGFYVFFWCDTDHIQAARVVLYSQNRNAFMGIEIPAPTKEELGFYEE